MRMVVFCQHAYMYSIYIADISVLKMYLNIVQEAMHKFVQVFCVSLVEVL